MIKRGKWAPLGIAAVVLLLASCGNRVEGASDGAEGVPIVDATVAPGADGASFGTLPSPCGPNTTGGALTATGLGVTADAITITTISDPGGPKAGLNQGVFDAMKAFGDWCNAQGGVNGRTLNVELSDAKVFQYKDRILDACADSFALVGGIGVYDESGVDDYLNCGLVNIPAATVGVRAGTADRTIQPLPNNLEKYSLSSSNWVKQNYPQVVSSAGAIYTSNPPVIDFQNKRWVSAYTQNGFTFIQRQASGLNEANWGPLVVPLKNSGVKYLTFTSSFEEILPLFKEMNAQNYKVDLFELETNYYDPQFPQQVKEQAVDPGNAIVKLTMYPFEDADKNPAVKTMLDEMAKVDGKLSGLSVQAWSAGLLFATAAKKAGANLTRESLMTALNEIHAWDAGGLHGPTDPAGKKGSPCVVMMKVEDGGFKRVYPLPDKDKAVYENPIREGMACPEDAIVTLKDPPKMG